MHRVSRRQPTINNQQSTYNSKPQTELACRYINGALYVLVLTANITTATTATTATTDSLVVSMIATLLHTAGPQMVSKLDVVR
jgi:hypothetical protein